MRPCPSYLLAAFILVAVPCVVQAQTFVIPPSPDADKNGCTGFGYSVTLSHLTRTASSMVVTQIDSLSPSAIAGLRSGDSVVAINGSLIADKSIGIHWRTPPGTTHTLKIRRGGRDIQVVFVSGKKDVSGADPEKTPPCRPLPAPKP